MRIVNIKIDNFRCVRSANIYPTQHNVLLGPNNTGKTTILEAINMVLNPELTFRTNVIDENDFYNRHYLIEDISEIKQDSISNELENNGDVDVSESQTEENNEENPEIYIEITLSDFSTEDEDQFNDKLVVWDPENNIIIESTQEGEEPLKNAQTAIRVCFSAWYDQDEDDFDHSTYFLNHNELERENCPRFGKEDKRYIGFLIYRDFRALTRPITLEPFTLFGHLLRSQESSPKNFEEVLDKIRGILDPIFANSEFESIMESYKAEIERYLILSVSGRGGLSFEFTDQTRRQLKASSQLFVEDDISFPIQKLGAGTRSLSILSILTLIMRRRGRGILALEEPETFLFPHAQRRVLDECISLADQLFVTTHSPYVLERMPVEGVGRIERNNDDDVSWTPISTHNLKQINLYTKRLKQSHSEALMGSGVIIVEGDSDRWWLSGASRILNRKKWNGQIQEALELQGISVISADSDGDILKLGRFFSELGLNVISIFDSVSDKSLLDQILDCEFPSLLLRYSGLEELLSNELSISILSLILEDAPYSKKLQSEPLDLSSMNEEEIREASKEKLIINKGSRTMHEWIMSKIDDTTLPTTLGDIIDIVNQHMSGRNVIGSCTLLKK